MIGKGLGLFFWASRSFLAFSMLEAVVSSLTTLVACFLAVTSWTLACSCRLMSRRSVRRAQRSTNCFSSLVYFVVGWDDLEGILSVFFAFFSNNLVLMIFSKISKRTIIAQDSNPPARIV